MSIHELGLGRERDGEGEGWGWRGMERERNGTKKECSKRASGPEVTHSMNPLLGLQPSPILIHILIRPFYERKGGSIMIHIPPYPGLGEDECFLYISGDWEAGENSIDNMT